MTNRATEGGAASRDPLRAMVLGLFLFACVGTGAELLLLEHFEDWQQWIPLVLLALGVVAGAATGLRPTAPKLRAFRLLMVAFAGAGVAGLYLHYTGNAEFEREMYPSLAGPTLVWEALKGATPALAPGTMIGLGVLGFVFTYRHPALADRGAETPEDSTSRQGATT